MQREEYEKLKDNFNYISNQLDKWLMCNDLKAALAFRKEMRALRGVISYYVNGNVAECNAFKANRKAKAQQ